MRSQRLTADSDIGSGHALRVSGRMLACVVLLLACSSGCVMPCLTGACNSKEPLYVSPMARFGAVETRIPECEPVKAGKAWPYFTFGKYWPFLDQWKTTTTATKAARRILWRQMWDTKSWINAHYRAGFTQAYIDVANGGNGELPPVPPPQYWNAHFRSAKGQWRAERWFEGYRAGSAMALVDMQSLRRITASYDWSIEKPKPPFASSPLGVGNVGLGPGCPPVVQTGGYGMPGQQQFGPQQFGQQQFGPQSVPRGGYPTQQTAPGYGQAPPGYGQAPWGPSAPGTPYSQPGPPHQSAPSGAFNPGAMPPSNPGLAPGPGAAGGLQSQPPATSPGFQAQPTNPVPGARGSAEPGPIPPGNLQATPAQRDSGGLLPGHSGSGNNVTPAPGGSWQGGPQQAEPKRLVPGFSPNANLPANIPNDPPVWRTRPPGNVSQ